MKSFSLLSCMSMFSCLQSVQIMRWVNIYGAEKWIELYKTSITLFRKKNAQILRHATDFINSQHALSITVLCGDIEVFTHLDWMGVNFFRLIGEPQYKYCAVLFLFWKHLLFKFTENH